VLNVRGQILPSTLENVSLTAITEDGERIHGESRITEAGKPLRELFIDPTDVQAYPEAVDAIADRLTRWLQSPPELRAATRAALVDAVAERYSWEGVARGVIAAALGENDALVTPLAG